MLNFLLEFGIEIGFCAFVSCEHFSQIEVAHIIQQHLQVYSIGKQFSWSVFRYSLHSTVIQDGTISLLPEIFIRHIYLMTTGILHFEVCERLATVNTPVLPRPTITRRAVVRTVVVLLAYLERVSAQVGPSGVDRSPVKLTCLSGGGKEDWL